MNVGYWDGAAWANAVACVGGEDAAFVAFAAHVGVVYEAVESVSGVVAVSACVVHGDIAVANVGGESYDVVNALVVGEHAVACIAVGTAFVVGFVAVVAVFVVGVAESVVDGWGAVVGWNVVMG